MYEGYCEKWRFPVTVVVLETVLTEGTGDKHKKAWH